VVETTTCDHNIATMLEGIRCAAAHMFVSCSASCSYADQPSAVFGRKLREQVEERLSFFESGELPRKNIEVMKEAMSELEAEKVQQLPPAAG